jgi:RsiW-degrading membrane proteinase PrsW (M82 family)
MLAFFLLKGSQQKWVQKYVNVWMLFLMAIPFVWLSKTQQLPLSILPILVLLMVRYLFLSKRLLTFK